MGALPPPSGLGSHRIENAKKGKYRKNNITIYYYETNMNISLRWGGHKQQSSVRWKPKPTKRVNVAINIVIPFSIFS